MGASKSRHHQQLPPSSQKQSVDLSVLHARVDRIHIGGLQRTHDDYVWRAVQNCFDATTFQELLLEVEQAKANLYELGIFKEINANVDVSRGESATKNGYELTFTGTELRRITGSVGTEIGNNEGSVVTEMALPNLAGRGERFSVHGSYSNAKATDINVRLSKPFYHTALGHYKPEISVSIFKNTAPFPWYKYTTHDMGMLLDYSFQLGAGSVQHNLQYEYAVREIGSVGRQVPFSVREHCGPRLCSLLRHIWSYDRRDSSVLPSQGIHVRMTNEMCGLGGNVAYVKNTTHAEINVPLLAGISAQLCGRVGILQSDKLAPTVPLSNLFTLGGPMTLRGFHMAGVGSHAEGVASGAQTFWAAGLHLWSPLPFNRSQFLADHFRVHGFATLGNVNAWTVDTARCSIGAGLAFRIGQRARIELNYCRPVWKQPNDAVQKEGFQFGIGYEFL